MSTPHRPRAPRSARSAAASALTLLALAAPLWSQGQAEPAATPAPVSAGRPRFDIPRATAPVKADGRLSEETWSHALVMELPWEIEPGENIPAPVRTECLLAYDEDNLYVGFRAHDPRPDSIRAHLTDRDRCFRDDFVGIMIDPFNDERRGFEFFVNPLGVQMDLSRNEVGSGNNEDENWDAIWSSGGRITATGYEVEMVIPFTSLRFPRASGPMTWGVAPFRAYPRNVRHQLASVPNDRNKTGLFTQCPKVVGFEGARPGKSLELTPTLTASRTDLREDFPYGPMENGEIDVDPGLSVSWGMTPNLILNATANPDFSQVEADVAQLEINRRFALFYPEKRPFFLEGADFFQTPMRAVHTRSVADPDFGLKITGKEGPIALGGFVAQDAVTNVLLPGSRGSSFAEIEGAALDGVLRIRRDVGANSTVGLLLTARHGEGYDNYVAGVDGMFRVTNVDTVRFQLLGTQTRYPGSFAQANDQPLGWFAGVGSFAEYYRDSRDWSWWAGYVDKERDFRADLGFIAQTDVRGPFAGIQRILTPKNKTWYTRLSFGVESDHAEDQNGELVNQYAHALVNWSGPLQAYFEGNYGPGRERFEGVTYDLWSGWFFFNIRPSGDFTSSIESRFGDAIDYENSRAGEVLNITPGITYDPGHHLRLQFDHTFEQLDAEGERVYIANLSQAKIIYQFDARTFVRAILQFTNIDRNVGNYLDPETEPLTRELFAQLLFSYKLSPQTLFHVGYSDNQQATDQIQLTRADRTIFAKLSYAWRP